MISKEIISKEMISKEMISKEMISKEMISKDTFSLSRKQGRLLIKFGLTADRQFTLN